MTILKQKSLGQAIMVSDFIEEDYLWHADKQARLLLDTQIDGYFNSDKVLLQVDKAIDIFEAKYPIYQGLFVFDNAPSHKKCPDDALRVENMNVRPGGKQPVMRNTVFSGIQLQRISHDSLPELLQNHAHHLKHHKCILYSYISTIITQIVCIRSHTENSKKSKVLLSCSVALYVCCILLVMDSCYH